MTDSRFFPTVPNEERKVVMLLLLSGGACLAIGLLVLASPTAFANRLGYTFINSTGKTEFMTFYGGFYAGIGLFLLVAARKKPLRVGAVAFSAFSATAAIPVRLYGVVLFGSTTLVVYQLLLGELLFAGAGWLGWYWLSE